MLRGYVDSYGRNRSLRCRDHWDQSGKERTTVVRTACMCQTGEPNRERHAIACVYVRRLLTLLKEPLNSISIVFAVWIVDIFP